jgi:hypothetical protein
MYENRLKVIERNREKEDKLRRFFLKNNKKRESFIGINEDITNIPCFKGCFTKTLKHDDRNIPDEDEVMKMIKGVRKCKCDFENIIYPGATHLVNPSVVFSTELMGPSKSTIKVEPPPLSSSREIAADMVELYNMALLRDVPFSEYEDNPLVDEAIRDLNKLTGFTGPKENRKVTPQTLFRGNTRGDLTGPYISQLLYLPYSSGALDVTQQYTVDPPDQDFMTTWETALSVQNGTTTETLGPRVTKRYITTMRDMCTYVHLDDVFADALYAALVLKKLNCPAAPGIPFGKEVKESAFVDCADCDLYACMSYIARITLMHTWYHKWNYLKIRPEELGMNIHQYKIQCDQELPINEEFLRSSVLDRIYEKFDSYLLPQAFPEGCPPHPSYPQAHGATISAAVTILKAFKDEDFMIDAFAPNIDGSELVPLGYKVRVGDELDKFVSNIALARCGAGVHYRSDCVAWNLGEQVAIKMLKEYVLRYCQPTTFKFHKRNGKLVIISNQKDN